jgi:hypothetical protein
MKNYWKWLVAASLVLAAAIPPLSHRLGGDAQASVDSWSGHSEVQVPFTASITAGTPALVMSAATVLLPTGSTAACINIRSITITDTASGYVRLYNGQSAGGLPSTGYSGTGAPPGSALIATFSVLANSPLVLNEDQLGQGIMTSVGSSLWVDSATGTTCLQVRARLQTQSVR